MRGLTQLLVLGGVTITRGSEAGAQTSQVSASLCDNPDLTGFPNTMIATMVVELDGVYQTQGTLRASDSSNQCRGFIDTPDVAPFGPYVGVALYQLNVYGDSPCTGCLSYSFLTASGGVAALSGSMGRDFIVNGVVGTLVAPAVQTGTKSPSICLNTCTYADDSVCDDGGVGSAWSACIVGTDCSDCGQRASTSNSTGTTSGGSATTPTSTPTFTPTVSPTRVPSTSSPPPSPRPICSLTAWDPTPTECALYASQYGCAATYGSTCPSGSATLPFAQISGGCPSACSSSTSSPPTGYAPSPPPVGCTEAQMCPSGTYESSPIAYRMCCLDDFCSVYAFNELDPNCDGPSCVEGGGKDTEELCTGAGYQWKAHTCAIFKEYVTSDLCDSLISAHIGPTLCCAGSGSGEGGSSSGGSGSGSGEAGSGSGGSGSGSGEAGSGSAALSPLPSPPPPQMTTLSVPLNANGWTFISLNVELADKHINSVFSQLSLTMFDHIKNQLLFSDYYEGWGWFGALVTITTNEMYALKLTGSGTLNLTGTPTVLPKTLFLNDGWTGLPCPYQTAVSLAEGAPNFDYKFGDQFKSQLEFSDYYEGWGWFGPLLRLKPGAGYRVRVTKGGYATFS